MRIDMREFFDEFAKQLEKMRSETLFCEAADATMSPICEQHFLLAISALESAQRFAQLAAYYASRND